MNNHGEPPRSNTAKAEARKQELMIEIQPTTFWAAKRLSAKAPMINGEIIAATGLARKASDSHLLPSPFAARILGIAGV